MERLRQRFRTDESSLDISQILQRTLGAGAAFLLFGLILVTCVDVVGRYLFSTPLTGAFEITEVLLAGLVFAALPLTTERKEHIEVDLLNVILTSTIKRYLSALAGLFSAALLATFSWRLAAHAFSSSEIGAVTNVLNIPLAPFGYLASFSCLVSAFIAFLRGIHPPRNLNDRETEEHD